MAAGQVEGGLLIGNMDAATDILSLEGHGVTHIVTVSGGAMASLI